MKKLIIPAIVFSALLSCTKKPVHALQDSNIMLEEPKINPADTAKAVTTQAAATTPAQQNVTTTADSTKVQTPSAK